MKKLQINSAHRNLIESVIRENPKYKGNEELMEIFCESIYKKSYLIIDAIRDMARLRRHLTSICDGCMEQVLKEKQKYTDTKNYQQIRHDTKIREDIVSLKKTSLTEQKSPEEEFANYGIRKNIVNLKEEIQRSEKYDSVDSFIDPIEFRPKKRVSQNTVEKLIKVIKTIDTQFPNKRYYEIFSLRYLRRYNQMEVAREMMISQVELSKRFVEMIKLTREML